ncbi:hypothetical protein QQS45_00155 [Alteriqipengyuania flavescens]|uniref:hypothetical protein n=1 Tax=Alteriqipengyuania flavescens TaxID=3053610 RepID=UPI0025B57EA1|nr:hypothetical protein [Alteriqipengyuania flavescens]WJY18702.1 hypothetical protein QQW98_00155 [Alteriqipengyuania flavescens]WJY24642.1 hypothetical protein QQS45_00155 [Alteriqipengyuania flavescens]
MASPAQRRAWLAGYTGRSCPRHASRDGRDFFLKGRQARTLLDQLRSHQETR